VVELTAITTTIMKTKTLQVATALALAALSIAPFAAAQSLNSHANVHASAGTNVTVQNENSLPPGIRNAPGIQKRIDDGKGLPQGLLKFLNGFTGGFSDHKGSSTHATSTPPATTTPDTTAPQILNSFVHAVSTSSASFFVLSNENTTASLWLSTTTPVNTSGSATASSSALVNFHDIKVTGLASSTLYYYVLGVSDSSNNTATSSGFFTTM
jgi:hypothetical protein